MSDKSVVQINWSQPIEAVHDDGRTRGIDLLQKSAGAYNGNDHWCCTSDGGRFDITPGAIHSFWVSDDGRVPDYKGWRIRNVASNPLNLETSDLDPITPEEDALATAVIAALGFTRQAHDTVVRGMRAGLAKAGAVIVPTSVLTPFLSVAPYMKGRNSIVTGWNNDRVEYADFRALADAVPVSAHSIQSGGEGGKS